MFEGSSNNPEVDNKITYEEIHVRFLSNGRPERELPEVLDRSSARVVFIGDNHHDTRIRQALSYPIAQRLKKNGFTHYCIEGSEEIQPLLDILGHGKTIDLYGNPKIGPGSFGDRSFADAVNSMSGSGMRVIAIDDARNFNGQPVSIELRESTITTHLLDILKDNTSRVCVLIGEEHAVNMNLQNQTPSTASRLLNAGISVLTICFSG